MPLESADGDEAEPVRARLPERVSDDGGVEPAGRPLGGSRCGAVIRWAGVAAAPSSFRPAASFLSGTHTGHQINQQVLLNLRFFNGTPWGRFFIIVCGG